jgi:hypothetical protein
VGSLRRLLVLALGAGAVAGLLVAVWPERHVTRTIVTASLSPRAPLFGDTVIARIDAPADARVAASFRPFTVRAASRHGTVRTYALRCLSPACVPEPGSARTVAFRSAVVSVPGRQPLAIAWPPLRVGSRLAAEDVARPSFRADTALPRATSSADPELVGWALTALAGALLLGATIWSALSLRPRPRRERERSPLERALELVERSMTGPAARRRAALDQLAVELGDDPFAGPVRTLAWSPTPPEPPALGLLADEVRETSG